MVSRPGRPKAADLDQYEVLTAVDDANAHGTWVGDYFPGVPGKVVISKLRKMQNQGLVAVASDRYVLTQAGREALLG